MKTSIPIKGKGVSQKMKIGCISWSHRLEFQSGKLDVFKWMEHCKREAGLDGVEIWNNHITSLEINYLDKIKNKATDEGLEIYSVATKCQYGSFSKQEISQAQQTMQNWMDATVRLGVPVMRISIGGECLRDTTHRDIVIDSLTTVISTSRYPSIKVGIENQEPGVIQNTQDVKELVRRSNGTLGLVLDNGSFTNKEDSYSFMRDTLHDAVVVHLKFFNITVDGSDLVLDYNRVVPILRESGYNGYLSIEYDSDQPASRDVPIITNYLRRMFR
jgi:sugar phosphate isomerase/epimerase